MTVVAAAGNDGGDAASFVPAAYDEVIAVSAFTDFDGQRSSAGCQADFSDYGYQCDDTLADFSDYGSVVDVTAPGVHVLSDWIDGGLKTISGTSMAAPHVAGAAALVLGANPSLTPAQVRTLLESTGECPDGTVANAATCAGHGQWKVGGLFGTTPDKDGIPEPLVNALRAAQAAGTPRRRLHRLRRRSTRSRRRWRSPHRPPTPPSAAPSTCRRTPLTTSAVAHVDFYDGATLIGTDSSAPYSVPWTPRRRSAHAHGDRVRHRRAQQQRHAARSRSTTPRRRPTVTSPLGGTVSGTISITGDSSDPAPGSGVASVQFLVDGNVVAHRHHRAVLDQLEHRHDHERLAHDRRPRHRRGRERRDLTRRCQVTVSNVGTAS